MIHWASRWLWWFASRGAITLACILTIQNLLHHEGYFVEFKILLLGAICLIVGTSVWMHIPTSHSENKKKDTSWSGYPPSSD